MTYSKMASALACGVCIVTMATPARSQTRTYNIPPGSLNSALDAFSRQSGRPIIYKADLVRGIRSRGAKGSSSSDAALSAILAGTPFRGQTDSSGAIPVVPVGNGNADASQDAPRKDVFGETGLTEAEAGEEIIVTGSNIRGATGAAPTLIIKEREMRRGGG